MPDGVILVRRAARLGTGCGHDDRFNLDTIHALRRDDEGCEETEEPSVGVALVFSNGDLGAVVVGVNEWTYTSEPAALFESFDREVRVSRTPRPPRSGRGFQVRPARGGNPQRDPLRGRSRRLGKRRESRAAAEGRCEKPENDDRPCSHRAAYGSPLSCGRAWYTNPRALAQPSSRPSPPRVVARGHLEDRFARASVCSGEHRSLRLDGPGVALSPLGPEGDGAQSGRLHLCARGYPDSVPRRLAPVHMPV